MVRIAAILCAIVSAGCGAPAATQSAPAAAVPPQTPPATGRKVVTIAPENRLIVGGCLMEIVRRSPDPVARWQAARGLGALKFEEAGSLLIECLRDTDRFVRANAARALGDMKIEAARAPLLALIEKEEDGGVVEQTSLALRQMKVVEALPALRRLADHPNRQTRACVLQAVGDLGGRNEVPFLAARLEHPDADTAQAAARALEDVLKIDFGVPKTDGPHSPEEGVSPAKEWWSKHKSEYDRP